MGTHGTRKKRLRMDPNSANPSTVPARGMLRVISFTSYLIFAAVHANAVTGEFLRATPGPQAAALGNAGVADGETGFSSYYNPALPSRSPHRVQLAGEHTQWFVDTQAAHFALGIRPGFNAAERWGIGFFFSRWDTQPFEATGPTGDVSGEVGFEAYNVGLAVARRMTEAFHVGAALKSISQSFQESGGSASYTRDTARAWDAGLAYAVPLPGIVAGAAIQNMGERMTFAQKEERLPQIIRSGFQGTHVAGRIHWRGEAVRRRGKTSFSGGLEYRPFSLLAIRGGYDTLLIDRDLAGFSSGLSLRFDTMSFDYALTPLADLGVAQRFAVQWRFGRARPLLEPKEKLQRHPRDSHGSAQAERPTQNTVPSNDPLTDAELDKIFNQLIKQWAQDAEK